MPDFSDEPVKCNPAGPGRPSPDINDPASDWSGYARGGGPMGLITWQRLADILAADEDSPLAAALAPSAVTQIDARGRFTDGDAAGKYILGDGAKAASGANATEPMAVFPASADYMALRPNQLWVCGAVFAVNGTAIPDTVDIDVGFYRVAVGGGADVITYTLSDTGKIIETYNDGIGSGVFGDPNPDRRGDFAAAGDQNYGIGVELHSALPADCVLDVTVALQLSPY